MNNTPPPALISVLGTALALFLLAVLLLYAFQWHNLPDIFGY